VQATGGLIFSQALLLAMTRKNLSREQAYDLVQKLSLKVWREKKNLKDEAQADPDIRRVLSPAEIEACFSLDPYLEKIDFIFERVLGNEN